ncbi:MAG: prepilin-type N-terminal cleavage/methylation domain-containing protein [Candidatus Paceibacterota bacterium]|jgi:prepilin-type N-terminal cleavage/methylation domain-containing protein
MNFFFCRKGSDRGFTLIELLIVIAIVAILATITLLVLNPSEMLRKARDSKRISDLKTINDAIGLSVAQIPPLFIGTSTFVYVSLPDSDPNCATYNLPSLGGTGKTYSCRPESSYRKTDGTGWVPVNFDSLPSKVLSVLPVDPVNSNNASSGLYYTYVAGSWELDAKMESAKYGSGGTNDVSANDGGDGISLFEIGSRLTLVPIVINDRTGASSTPGDTAPPATVADLGLSGASTSTINLSWTAPGDDESSGTAASYDIRYSTSLINAGNFGSAAQVSAPPTPQVAGSAQGKMVTGLSPNTTYYFAIKTSDEVPNVSGISNVPNLSTKAETTVQVPPGCAVTTSSAGATWEVYTPWTIPGSGSAQVTKLWYYDYDGSISGVESIVMGIYNGSAPGAAVIANSSTTLAGSGSAGSWISGSLVTPISITLGQTYIFGIVPKTSTSTYSMGGMASPYCSAFPPNFPPNQNNYYSGNPSNYILDSTVPAAQTVFGHFGIVGITYIQ